MTYTKTCEHCGMTYTAERSNSKYHNDACRVAAYRERIGQSENAPELRLAIDSEELSSMRVRVRPMDIEVEYAARDGRYEQKHKQWFTFEEYPVLETLYNYGTWDMTLLFKLARWYKIAE